MSGLLLKGINKVYPSGVQAVFNFCLDIRDKEFIVLVGPSGCGKSTTLRMIAGLEEISSGELYIDGKLVNDVVPKDRDIAMVFQNYALYPHMSVYDNMAFGLKLRKVPKEIIDQKVKAAAEILGITDYLSRKPKALSGGQRQRVALGRTIVREPKVFLLDEPLSNLDAKLRASMRTEISKLHARLATTFIYVTHDQAEAMSLSDKIIIMNGGVVEQMGTPQETYYSPKSAFVADFIGEANFLEGVVEKHDVMKIADVSVPVKTGDMAAGTACRLVLRPESVTLKDTGILPCKVVYSCFMGSYQSYHVQVKDMLVKLEEYNPKNKRVYQVGEDAFLNFEEGTVFPL